MISLDECPLILMIKIPMPGQACIFKAFRTSVTLLAARYIASQNLIILKTPQLGIRPDCGVFLVIIDCFATFLLQFWLCI